MRCACHAPPAFFRFTTYAITRFTQIERELGLHDLIQDLVREDDPSADD
jgi:hypothetical protein